MDNPYLERPARLYFHLQMLADLEMNIDITTSSPISGETNCGRTRGDYGEKQCASLVFIIPTQFDWYTDHQFEFLTGLKTGWAI
jgi:hypothetical protein